MYIKKIILTIAMVGLIVGGFLAYYVYAAVFDPNTNFEAPTATITIPTTATYAEVFEKMKPLIKNPESFDRIARKKGYANRIKPGRYILEKGSSNNTLVDNLRSKNTPLYVTFNNQERLENLAGRIAEQIEADSLSLLQEFKEKSFLSSNGFNQATALGMYIPNKYQFFWNTSASQFKARMLKEYHRFWNNKRVQKAKKIGLSLHQVTTIAAIVQKETAKVAERPKIAGVYMNRYNNNWKLDADPTVIFALKKYRNDWKTPIKRVLYKDLKLESPYNTYKNKALPPGPISMPDISAIDAVLNYEKHSYYFFVADPTNQGYHRFSKTLSEHNRNRKKYVKWIDEKGIKR